MKNYFLKFFAFLTLLFSVGVGEMWGWTNRTYDGNTKLYISNIKPNGWSNGVWSSDDNNQLFVCLKKSDNSETWCTPTLVAGSAKYAKGALYSITPPSGTYQRFNIVRGSAADWDHDTNSTNDLDFNSDNNFITHYKDGAGDNQVTWGKIDPRTITSDGTGVLYFDATVTSGFNWDWNCQISTAGDANFAYFFNNTNGEWSEHSTHITGDYYAITVPEGTWTGVILSRQKATSNPGFGDDKQWNQTAEIPFVYGKNCLTNYAPDNYDYVLSWGDFIPSSTILLDGSMNGWSLITAKPFSDGSLEVDLAAHKTYDFKIVEGNNGTGTWYGLTSANCIVSTMGLYGCSSSGNNIPLNTAGQGTYTFEYNASHQLSVTYPTASHPSMDYVYLRNYDDWANPHVHFEGTSASGVAGTSGGGQQLKGLSSPSTITNTTSFTILGKSEGYYYCAVGDFPQVNLHNNDAGANESGNKDVERGHRLYHDGKEWVWGTLPVWIGLDRRGVDNGDDHVDTEFNDPDHLPSRITTPTKSHYDFGGYYTGWNSSTNEVAGTRIIDENGDWIVEAVPGYKGESGEWIHEGSVSLYAKWTKHPYTINLTVTPNHVSDSDPLTGGTIQIGGEDKTSMNAYQDSASVDIYAVPANDAYIFKEWRFSQTESIYDVYVDDGKTYSSTSNPIKIRAGHDGTLTAVFQSRYGLVGSRYDNEAAGMPGWEYGTAADFIVKGFTSLGEGADKVDLECARTLGRATSYKFRIYDRVKKQAVGCGTEGAVLPAEYDLEHGIFNNWQLTHIDDGHDVNINTLGRGTYTFHITNISNDDNYWPSVQVDRQQSYQVHLGWKHAEAENLSSLSTGNDGGTASVTVNEGAGSVSVANNDWVADGSTITINAVSASSYDFAGWWDGDAYTGGYVWGPGSPIVEWTVSATVNAFAKFVEKTNTFEGDETGHETEWNQTGNWSADHIPTINEVAIIPKQVVVDITDAKAKRVLIKNDSPNNGQIEIPAGKELIVAQTIKQTTDGSTYGATGYDDIIIGSSLGDDGNGALVMGAHDGTNKATVYFATKAKTTGEGENKHNVNQFIGTPFNDENDILYDYYGTKIYRFMAAHDGNLGDDNEWKRVASTGEKMNGFFGYNILTNQTTEPVLEMTGTLCKSEVHSVGGYYKAEWDSTENMFANSWVAPIYIPNFEDDDFTNMERTIYIFNAGTPADQGSYSTADGSADNTSPGQYVVLPIHASPWVGMKVIPSMQAFSVFANDENPKLTFNYTRLVYNPALATGEDHAGIVANRAPQRTSDADAPSVLRLATTGESGYAAKIVLLERTDFTDGYDDGWDGRFLAGDDAAPQLYAVTSDGNMAINCVPEVEGTVLGFKAGEADEVFTFSFDYDGEALYLYDTQTQTYTRVLTGNTYIFSTDDHGEHNRFVLTHNAPQSPTGVENTQELKTVKFIENDHLYIFQNGRLYDAAGRIVK